MELLTALYADDRGFIVSIELILIVTIVVIGTIAGLAVLRDAIISELEDVSRAVESLDQQGLVAHPADLTAGQPSEQLIDDPNGYSDSPADNCVQVYGRLDF